MNGSSSEGAFIAVSSAGLGNGNYYLEIVNMEDEEHVLPAIGNAPNSTAVLKIDDTAASWQTFAGGADDTAVPYDGTLLREYQGKYPFRTVGELAGLLPDDSLPLWVKAHYGDWPFPETDIVNMTN